ncbi:MAG: hypothetical protein QOG94_332 [Solirubrobacteraceae bacterium]|nr:hypothetical protein [Solirubrobacteraceae bacterium]
MRPRETALRGMQGVRTRTAHALSVTRRRPTGYRCAAMTYRKLLLAALLLTCLCAPAAQAAPDQVSIVMDDDQLLYRGDRTMSRTLVTARSLGAEAVRVTVLWRVVGEGAALSNKEIERLKTDTLRDKARAQRKRFKPADPRTYPTRNWDRFDNLVKTATGLGMRVYFTVTGPGPSYAHHIAPPSQRANAGTFKPYPSRYRSFVQAVGARYSGTHKDENGIRKVLPRVSLWSLWNEPNQPGWLSPQWENGVPASPALYRELYAAGYQGLTLSGHGDDAILFGETSPLGSPKTGARNGIRPVPFLREVACVDPSGAPYAGPAATARHCEDFARIGPLKATAYAHHPYTKKGAPSIKPAVPDEITMGNIDTLGPLLDTISAQSGGMIPTGLPILLTEFGYESNPPDTRNGIPLLRQAQFNQLAEFIAYKDPRVLGTTQFLIRDAAPLTQYPKGSRLYWFTYQSGLYNLKGRAKPAAFAYTFPLVIYNPGIEGMSAFWGQLRFRPNGSTDNVVVFWREKPANAPKEPCGPGNGWTEIVSAGPTTYRGYFEGTFPTPGPGGYYCAVFLDTAQDKITHRSLTVSP